MSEIDNKLEKIYNATKNMIGTRKENNMKIIELLQNILTEHPDLRFGQAIEILGVIPNEHLFFEEPKITLEKMTKNFKKRLK